MEKDLGQMGFKPPSQHSAINNDNLTSKLLCQLTSLHIIYYVLYQSYMVCVLIIYNINLNLNISYKLILITNTITITCELNIPAELSIIHNIDLYPKEITMHVKLVHENHIIKDLKSIINYNQALAC